MAEPFPNAFASWRSPRAHGPGAVANDRRDCYGNSNRPVPQSAFSSYGRKGDAHTNDPRRWKHKASAAKLHEDGIQYVLPGSRCVAPS
jgi:hypothetical protein